MKKSKNENIDCLLNWIDLNVEHVKSMLTICKKEDSYIPGALKEAFKFTKDLEKIITIWRKHKDNPAKFTQGLTAICDQSKTGMTPKKQSGKKEKRTRLTMDEYLKKMDEIMNGNQSIPDKLTEALSYASTINIVKK